MKKISDIYGISYEELLKGTAYGSQKNKFRKYILLFILMISIQVIFIVVFSIMSDKYIKSNYKCLGSQTYYVLEVYDSEDNNYSYVTLKKNDTIKTVKVSKVISSLVEIDGNYEFIFRGNDNNDDIDYIFDNNEIINVIKTDKDINNISCK